MRSIYVVIIILVFSATLLAGGPRGFYLGAGLGSAFIKAEPTEFTEEDLNFDKSNFAYKVFAGFHLNDFLVAEGGYRNLGGAENKLLGYTVKSETYGWDVAAVGKVEILMLYAFGKAGAFFWNTKSTLDENAQEDKGTDFMWGVGVGANLGLLEARLEWEKFEVKNPESLSMVSLGVTFGF